MQQKIKHTAELTQAECLDVNGGVLNVPMGLLFMDEVGDCLSDLWTGIKKGFDAGASAGSKIK